MLPRGEKLAGQDRSAVQRREAHASVDTVIPQGTGCRLYYRLASKHADGTSVIFHLSSLAIAISGLLRPARKPSQKFVQSYRQFADAHSCSEPLSLRGVMREAGKPRAVAVIARPGTTKGSESPGFGRLIQSCHPPVDPRRAAHNPSMAAELGSIVRPGGLGPVIN